LQSIFFSFYTSLFLRRSSPPCSPVGGGAESHPTTIFCQPSFCLPLNFWSQSTLKMSIEFPAEEEIVLKRWKEIDAFNRQVELTQGREPYTFYDGPPFATGLPHYGHLLASTIKDIIPRYWAMKGYYVERRFGWDTHGVPIEYEIDKKLGMSGLEAVEKLGIEKYNEECRAIVMRFAGEWRQTIERLGRWIDFDNDYKVRLNYAPDSSLLC
jgi:isoleucyl-tRNA synthetase